MSCYIDSFLELFWEETIKDFGAVKSIRKHEGIKSKGKIFIFYIFCKWTALNRTNTVLLFTRNWYVNGQSAVAKFKLNEGNSMNNGIGSPDKILKIVKCKEHYLRAQNSIDMIERGKKSINLGVFPIILDNICTICKTKQ